MPFVLLTKANRPPWQDNRQRDLQESYRIANKHFREFAKAYEQTVKGVLDKDSRDKLIAALARGDSAAVAASIPWYDARDPDSVKRWEKLQEKFDKTYGKILQEAGAAQMDKLGLALAFTLDNPYSQPWIRSHGGELIQGIGTEAREIIRDAVSLGFQLGNPPRQMADIIEASIGLTARDAAAVQRRLALHIEQGMNEDLASERASAYADELLGRRAENIARTETVAAEAQGTLQSWRVAEDEGLIVTGTQKQWIAAMGSDRTCEICEELDGMDPVDLDASWDSSFVGLVSAPPSHPSCRCALGLVLP